MELLGARRYSSVGRGEGGKGCEEGGEGGGGAYIGVVVGEDDSVFIDLEYKKKGACTDLGFGSVVI